MNFKYRKWRKYETDIITILFMGIVFTIFALITVIPQIYLLIPWGIYLLFPGLIMIASYFITRHRSQQMRGQVKGALNSSDKNRIGISNLSRELQIRERDIRKIIIDLRSNGEIKASFDSNSGDIILPEISIQTNSNIDTENKSSVLYCPYCGVRVEKNSKYCQSCGASVKD
ncbi:MAG: zinc ribbon domain-containing protein [Promethearchaeota archaeon]|nr:MAG: zinc ribbon domain-containing protein [Candidatus Lokiarchaeota archaeon]